MNRSPAACLLLYMTLVTQVNAQGVRDTMYFDRDWEQTTRSNASYYRIITFADTGDFLFIVRDYYLSGRIQMSGTYRSIRPDYKTGVFTYYYENGLRQAECEYDHNELDGPCREWYENGNPKSDYFYLDGKRSGSYKSWNEDGTAKLEIQYKDDKKHGYFISYHPNGKPARKDLYENDELIEGKCFNKSGEEIDYYPYIVMPSFPGGLEALRKFIENEINYPAKAYRSGHEGVVLVRFTVDEHGNIINPSIIRGDREDFNEEALRVISAFPPWIRGKIEDKPSPIEVSLPIEFQIK
jgi:TonB family protein